MATLNRNFSMLTKLSLFLIVFFSIADDNRNGIDEPLTDVIRYWKAIQKSNAVSENVRFVRLVGYIEGALDLTLPEWWVSEGLTPYAPPELFRPSTAYGSHPHDKLKIGKITYLISWHSASNSLKLTKQEDANHLIWEKTIHDLYPGLGIGGILSVDCALVESHGNLYVIGRSGVIRFIFANSLRSGEATGFMSFKEDGSYLHAAIGGVEMQPTSTIGPKK